MYPDSYNHDPPAENSVGPVTRKPGSGPHFVRLLSSRQAKRLTRIVIVSLGALFWFGFLGPSIRGAREAARRTSSRCALSILGLTTRNYYDQQGLIPAHTLTDSSGTPLHGWYAQLLPLLDNGLLYSKIDFSKPWDHPDNEDFFKISIGQISVCGGCAETDAAGFPVTMYSANSHVMGINSGITLDDVTDGTNQTLLIGEIVEALPPWGAPGNARDPYLGILSWAEDLWWSVSETHSICPLRWLCCFSVGKY